MEDLTINPIDISSITKLTDWVNEPTIADLNKNLTDAKTDHDNHQSDVHTWLDNRNIEGKAKVTPGEGKSKIVPKLIRKQAEWRYASLTEPFTSTPDLFNVNPVTAGDRKRAQQNSLVLNNQFNTQIDKIAFIDSYIREAVDTGTVICKVGWKTEEEEITEIQPIYDFLPVNDETLIKSYTQLLQLRKFNQDLYEEYMNPGLDQALTMFAQTGQTVVPQQVGEEEITEIKETVNQPTVEVCDGANIIIDPSCNGILDNAKFIGERFKTCIADLQKDGRYQNLDKINLEGASPLTDSDYEEDSDITTFRFEDDPRKKFVVTIYYGEWDINSTGILEPIIMAWAGRTTIRMEKNQFPDRKHPFVKAVYMPVRRSIFGEPDGALLEDNQKIVGAITRGMIDLMAKSANAQTGMRMDLLNTTNQRKFRRGDDYEFNSNVDPRQGIHQHTFPEIPSSAYNMITMQNIEAESLTGVKAFASSGITGESIGQNVGNARSALDAASKREKGILNRLASGIIQIGRKFLSMNAEFLSETEVIRITNRKFITVRRDDLAGKFDLRLSISTAEEDNKKAEELAFMLQTTGNTMDPDLHKMILADLARLRKMPDMARKIEEFQPQPDPLIKAEQELKIHLLKAQIAKEETLAIKHAATAELDGVKGQREKTQAALNLAKRGTEHAKARNLSSDSDNKDLDYLETESGTKQARDLEKMNTQAQNDAATKIIDNSMQQDNTNQQEKLVI